MRSRGASYVAYVLITFGGLSLGPHAVAAADRVDRQVGIGASEPFAYAMHDITVDPQPFPIPPLTPADVATTLRVRVRPGQPVAVRTSSGEEIVGAFVRASAASVTVEVKGVEREIATAAVQRVVLQRAKNRTARGLLLGAPLGVLFGSSGCYSVKREPHCGARLVVGAAAGASAGALIGSRVWRPDVVYEASPVARADAPSSLQPRVPPAAPHPAGVQPPAAVVHLADLGEVLHSFDIVSVQTTDGQTVTGRFAHVSDAWLAIEAKGRTREIAASDIREVRRRGGTMTKRGAGIGFLAVAALADSVVLLSDSDAETSVGGQLLLFTIAGGGAGALWGAAIGAFHHRQEVVYPAPARTVHVGPLLSPGRRGVMLAMSF